MHDLIVSPQHRILVGEGRQFEYAFERAYLVPAKALIRQPGIRIMRGKDAIKWIHFALDRHHVIKANGGYSESLYLGPMVVNGLTPDERLELQAIYGPMPSKGSAMNGSSARPFLTVGPRRMLASSRVRGDAPRNSEGPDLPGGAS